MKNETGKKILLLFFILILIAVAGIEGYYIYNLKTNNNTANNSEKTEVYANNNNETVEKVVEHIVEKKVVQPLIEDQVVVMNEKTAKSACNDGTYLHEHIRLPKFNLTTKEAKTINDKIAAMAQNPKKMNKDKNLYRTDITYTYKYLAEKQIYFLYISEKYGTDCATGTGNGVSYFYDAKNNKFLDLDGILKLYKITNEDIIEIAKFELENVVSYDDEEEREEQYKEFVSRMKQAVNKRDLTITDMENSSLTIKIPDVRINVVLSEK